MGSLDHPFNPVSLALGAEATFVARTIDSDRKHLTVGALGGRRPPRHVVRGDLPELPDLQRRRVRRRSSRRTPRADAIIPLVHGEPIRFGAGEDGGAAGLVRDRATGGVKVVEVGDGHGQVGADDLLVHDAHSPDPTTAFAISRLTDAGQLHQAPIGIFRQVARPTYDDLARDQIAQAAAQVTGTPTERLGALIGGGDTWTVA